MGGVSLCFSFPSVFLLFCLGVVLALDMLQERNWKNIKHLAIIFSIWGATFAIYYYFSLRHFHGDDGLTRFWDPAFLPIDRGFGIVCKWLVAVFKGYFVLMMQLHGGLAATFFIAGIVFSLSRDRRKGLLLLLPIFVLLVCSAFHIYPFGERTGLFLIPLLILIISKGAEGVLSFERFSENKTILSIFLAVLFLFSPFYYSFIQYKEKAGPEEIRPVLQYVQENMKEDDLIIVYAGVKPAFEYYGDRYDLNDNVLFFSRLTLDWKESLLKDPAFLKKLFQGERAWFIFTHVKMWRLKDGDRSEREVILQEFDSRAQRIDEFVVSVDKRGMAVVQMDGDVSAAAYLYDLKNWKEKK